MKIMKNILILAALVVTSIHFSKAPAQVTTSEGTDFWVTFMDNADTTLGSQTLSVFATSTRTCTLTATNPNTGWSSTMTVTPSNINQLYIPLSQAYSVNSNIVENNGIHITCTDTVSLYAITRGYPNQDYTNIIPTPLLMNDYLVQSFPTDRFSSEFAIVAAEDNITVDITLGGHTIDGHPSGDSYSIYLPVAGKSCLVKSTIPGDLSGSRITARNGKKIAVFNGNACIYIPNWSSGGSCDHVVEQALPTAYWGKKFIAAGSGCNRNDYVRITALNSGCTVNVNGSTVTTLAARATYQYIMSSNNAIDYIETSQPAIVYLYFASHNGWGNGDPSMTTIPPLEQGIDHAKFSVVSSGNVNRHYVHIFCPEASVGHIQLDNSTIPSSNFTSIPALPGYKHTVRELNQGVRNIIDESHNGFVIYMYGLGSRESYGYTIGTATYHLAQPYMTINGNDLSSYPNGMDICIDQDVDFGIGITEGRITNVDWIFDNNPAISNQNPITYQFTDTGEHHVYAYVTYIADTIRNRLEYDTFCTTIRVHPKYLYHVYDTVTESSLPYRHAGRTYTSDVEGDTIWLFSSHRCDSVEVFHLKIWYNDTVSFDTTICDTLLPFMWHDIRFIYDSTVVIHDTNIHGADSIVYYTLSTTHCRRPPAPDISVIDTNTLWIPNVFTPDRNSNRVFFIKGNNLLDAEVVIFHRWGNFVTRFDGLTEYWDGTVDGKPCPSGAYVYKIIYHFQSEPLIKKEAIGTVVLLR